MRKVLLLLLILAAVFGLYILWRSNFDMSMKTADYEKAQRHVANGQYEEAFELIKKHRNEFNTNYHKADWLNLAIRTVELMPEQTGALVGLYEKYPAAFKNHELASLLVAGELISNRQFDDYKKLRESWKDHSYNPQDWFVLDSDMYLLQGNKDKAKELLLSRSFEGPADTKRLIRLSFLSSQDNLGEAWGFLQQAEVKDPTNSTIHSLKGKVLEDLNQSDQAQMAYNRALELDPANVSLIEQLGEFYRRQGEFDLAINTWKKGLDLPKSDALWLKTLFWNKVYLPQLIHYTPPYNPLINYLDHLQVDEYWNQLDFDKLPKAQKYLKSEQETFWLPLIQRLARGDVDEVQMMLQYNPFKTHSWSPQIEQALRHVLAFRKEGNFDPDPILNEQTSKIKHHFFDQISSAAYHSKHILTNEKLPVEFRSLIRSDEVFTAIFLAGGWNEAAIYLHRMAVYPHDFPDWLAVEFTKALQKNRGKQAALSFALSQKQTDALKAVIKELSTSARQPE